MEGAKKRIFGVFEAFFYLYTPQKRRKHDTSINFAAFLLQRKNGRKRCRNGSAKGCAKGAAKRWPKNAAKFNKVLYLRRFCGAYKWQKMKKSQNPFTMSLGRINSNHNSYHRSQIYYYKCSRRRIHWRKIQHWSRPAESTPLLCSRCRSLSHRCRGHC